MNLVYSKFYFRLDFLDCQAKNWISTGANAAHETKSRRDHKTSEVPSRQIERFGI